MLGLFVPQGQADLFNALLVAAGGAFLFLVCKMSVFGFPLPQGNSKPEAINAKGNDGQQQPFDPVTEQLYCGTVKAESVPIDYGMFCFPVVDHAECPRKADAEREYRDNCAQYTPTNQLQKTAVKVRFVFH